MMIKIDKYKYIDSDDLTITQYSFFKDLIQEGYTTLAKSYASKSIRDIKYVGTELIEDYYTRLVTEDKARRLALPGLNYL